MFTLPLLATCYLGMRPEAAKAACKKGEGVHNPVGIGVGSTGISLCHSVAYFLVAPTLGESMCYVLYLPSSHPVVLIIMLLYHISSW